LEFALLPLGSGLVGGEVAGEVAAVGVRGSRVVGDAPIDGAGALAGFGGILGVASQELESRPIASTPGKPLGEGEVFWGVGNERDL